MWKGYFVHQGDHRILKKQAQEEAQGNPEGYGLG